MRPLISVLSAIGRFCAVITPTAGGAPGPVCPITGEASKSSSPKRIIVLKKATFIDSLSLKCAWQLFE
jgi:hypothetical protein